MNFLQKNLRKHSEQVLETFIEPDNSKDFNQRPIFQKFKSTNNKIKRPKTFDLLTINMSKLKPTSSCTESLTAKQQLEQFYTFEEQVGSGHQSVCLKVKHKETQRIYIAKIAHSSKNDQEFLSSLKQESKILSRLNHQNLIKIYENYETESEFIQVMEFVNKKSLEKQIFNRIFQEQEIISIAFQLLQTLDYLHSKRIIHRDINLSNIIYSRKYNIFKLLDFGVAKCQFNQTLFNLSSAGNKKFQAPEMSQCENYSEKIDIWGIGLILYSLLHSKIIGTKTVLKKKLNLLDCTKDFQKLLKSLLKKNQEKRISTSDALKLKVFSHLQ